MSAIGLYVHIPFCARLCPYCDFVSVAGRGDLHERYVRAVARELGDRLGRWSGAVLGTVYFGGGTPTELAPALLGHVLAAAAAAAPLAADAEITIEANPGTAAAAAFEELRARGFNRLSLGVQSFADATLARLGRSHTAAQAEAAVNAARHGGFDNLGLDLIASVPGAPEADWRRSVAQAIRLAPEHVSAYSLTVEEGTPWARQRALGRLPTVPEEEDARECDWTREQLVAAWYEHYEVSNYARPGRRSRHNWGYWTGVEYLGVGVSAHSFAEGRRRWNTEDLGAYLEAVEAGRSAGAGEETIGATTALEERLWLGLRTCEGAPLEPQEEGALEAHPRFRDLVRAGLVNIGAGRVLLTVRGLALADALAVELLALLAEAPCHA